MVGMKKKGDSENRDGTFIRTNTLLRGSARHPKKNTNIDCKKYNCFANSTAQKIRDESNSRDEEWSYDNWARCTRVRGTS